MAETTVRVARPKDAGALLEIYRPYVEGTAVTFELDVPSEGAFGERIARTLERYPWLVAEQAGEALGYAYAGPFKGRAAYDRCVETSVYLHPDARGRGIGRMLYEELESVLRRQGVLNANACITCSDARDDPFLTPASLHFHEHMGYSPVGTFHDCGFKFGRWYSVTWMEKMLGSHSPAPEPFTPFPDLARQAS